MARVAILKPNDKDINSVEGGWLGFHVIVVPVVKKMKKKVASSSTKALAQKWTLLSSDTNIILGVLVLASSPQYSLFPCSAVLRSCGIRTLFTPLLLKLELFVMEMWKRLLAVARP